MLRIAVDVGGTFTDGVAHQARGGRIHVAKTLTTPRDPGEAVATVVRRLVEEATAEGSRPVVEEVVHGTTLVANALIERRGARIALLVTRGTRDVPDIGRELRYDVYDLWLERPAPLVDAGDRFEVDERLGSRGEVVEAPDPERLSALCREVAGREYEAIAVCLLHAYVDDTHERAVGEALAAANRGWHVTLSSAVAPEMREYERMSTAAANAYVQPTVARYIHTLQSRLDTACGGAPLKIMVSSGGFTSADTAGRAPLLLLESGPAAGVLSAVDTARRCEAHDLLAFDMGGTTAKACVAMGGNPAMTHAFECARVRRFKKGSGLPILLPSLDLIEIGAGGGSIAEVNQLGLLDVGPRSAGSDPGPACYGLGGEHATVTDADLVLGYLSAEGFLGGEMVLRPESAGNALQRLADALDADLTAVAWRIVDVVNENMAVAARVHVAEKGHDPRGLTLVATGGAGPVHAVEVAAKLGIETVLVPVAAGAGSCFGLLAAPGRADRSWSRPELLAEVDWHEVRAAIEALRASAARELELATASGAAIEWRLAVEMRYAGQGHDVSVPLPSVELGHGAASEVEAAFRRRYAELYGREVPAAAPQCVTWRVTGRVHGAAAEFLEPPATEPSTEPRGRRAAYLPREAAFREIPVYDRYRLAPGMAFDAPAIIEERESTAVVARGACVRVLADRTLRIELETHP